MILSFATRPSALARWQTQYVIQKLQSTWSGLTCQEVIVTTQGDRDLQRSLIQTESKGLFTNELEKEILNGKANAAVHSLKDLPINSAPELMIGAILARDDVRDVFISDKFSTLEDLPPSAWVGTSSPRRAAQLWAYRAELQIKPMRGNVDTRIRKTIQGDFDAIILAAAGVARLGLEAYIRQYIPLEILLPAPGQGALAVQCRLDDSPTIRYLKAISDSETEQAVTAERSFLQGLGGGCSLPIAAYAWHEEKKINLLGKVFAKDGSSSIRLTGQGDEAKALGLRLAREALRKGARELMV